jgi:diguanylate cyclase (GGDEF)-like protein
MDPRWLAPLADLSRELLTDPGVQPALQRVADTALQLLGADHASVRLCEPDGQLRVGARAGVGVDRPAPRFRRGEGVIGWVAQTGRIARVSDSRQEPRFLDRNRGFAVGSILSVPVAGADRTLGVLSVSSPAQGAFAPDHELLATLLANAAAQVLRMAELREAALTDAQTRAYNRRYLAPRLREELERARRSGDALSVLLLDLDHFKRVNDEHGHAVGDAVLSAFADLVRGCVRSVDVLVRRGGEEFVLILPRTGVSAARAVAERIRRKLGAEPLQPRAGVLLTQTVSIGVASWDREEDAEALEERADRAMYEAKSRGRDRVAISAPVVTRRAG